MLFRTGWLAPEIFNPRGARPRLILFILVVGLIGLGGLHVYFFAIGLWGPLDTAIMVLHKFSLFGILGSATLVAPGRPIVAAA